MKRIEAEKKKKAEDTAEMKRIEAEKKKKAEDTAEEKKKDEEKERIIKIETAVETLKDGIKNIKNELDDKKSKLQKTDQLLKECLKTDSSNTQIINLDLQGESGQQVQGGLRGIRERFSNFFYGNEMSYEGLCNENEIQTGGILNELSHAFYGDCDNYSL